MTNKSYDEISWLSSEDVITLVNKSRQNYILDLPSGTYRLDAGRRMRTLSSILKFNQIQKLVDEGELVVEGA